MENAEQKRYIVARMFKDRGSAAIPIEQVTDFLAYIPSLEAIYKRKVEFLVLTNHSNQTLDDSWPEYAPFQFAKDKETFEEIIAEKMSFKKK